MYRVNESASAGATCYAKERLEIRRQVKTLEETISNWDKTGDIENGGLAPVLKRSSSAVVSLDGSSPGTSLENTETVPRWIASEQNFQGRLII